MPRNNRLYVTGSDVLAVRENGDTPPELFRRTGQTRNVRALATADAVIRDGMLLDVVIDEDGLIAFQDPWSGVKERHAPSKWVKPAIATFDQLSPVFEENL